MSGPGTPGDVLLEVEGVSLSFGGVTAINDISFDVREHEVRAIIGPNGAGKSSMLNVINGVYHPQQGRIRFAGETFTDMDPHRAAKMGISRTFQNIALFKGMSVLDNMMAGRNLRMTSGIFAQALRLGGGGARGDPPPRGGRADHRLPRDPGPQEDPGGAPALRAAEAGGSRPGAGDGTPPAAAG